MWKQSIRRYGIVGADLDLPGLIPCVPGFDDLQSQVPSTLPEGCYPSCGLDSAERWKCRVKGELTACLECEDDPNPNT